MQEHRLTVSRTGRYFTLGPTAGHPRQVWFVCHGYGQLAARFLREFEGLDDGTRLIVAPEGLSRYYLRHGEGQIGASWMTREERLSEIADYVRYLDAVYARVFSTVPRAATRVHVLGFSQGAATAARWISLGRAVADRLILWADVLPPDLDLDVAWGKLEDSRLTLVMGGEDEFVDPARLSDAEARLLNHEIPFETVRYAGGHRLDDAVLRQLATT